MSHDHHCLTPGQLAEVDQAAATYNTKLDQLTAQTATWLDGRDTIHAAAAATVSLMATATKPQLATLLGYALVRLAQGAADAKGPEDWT